MCLSFAIFFLNNFAWQERGQRLGLVACHTHMDTEEK